MLIFETRMDIFLLVSVFVEILRTFFLSLTSMCRVYFGDIRVKSYRLGISNWLHSVFRHVYVFVELNKMEHCDIMLEVKIC